MRSETVPEYANDTTTTRSPTPMRHHHLIEGLAVAAAAGSAALFIRWAAHARRAHLHELPEEPWEPFDPPRVLLEAVRPQRVYDWACDASQGNVLLGAGDTVYDASDPRWHSGQLTGSLRYCPPGTSVVIHRDGSGDLVLPEDEDWETEEPDWGDGPLVASPPPGWCDVTVFGGTPRWMQLATGGVEDAFPWEWTEGLEWERTEATEPDPAA